MDRLKQRGADLVYRCGKGHAEPLQSDKYAGELVLTPLELINPVPMPSAQVVGNSPMFVQPSTAAPNEPPAQPKPRPLSHDLWAALIARIYEVFPLICPMCGGYMRIIAFITFSADSHGILEHIGAAFHAVCSRGRKLL